LELFCTEADRPAPDGVSTWDSPVGVAIRRWCGPALGLDPSVPPSDYLDRRRALGVDAATHRLLGAAGLSHVLVDTGVDGSDLAPPAALGRAAGASVSEVVRLERVAEELAATGVAPDR